MDHDVIGSEPERAPRRRPPARGGPAARRVGRAGAAAPQGVRGLGVLVVVIGAVAVLRAGVAGLKPESGPGAPVAGAQRKPPLAGTVLALAAGQNTLYALASDCSAGCRPGLVASDERRRAPGRRCRCPGCRRIPGPVAGWQLAVSGVEDSLSVEDDAARHGHRGRPGQRRS